MQQVFSPKTIGSLPSHMLAMEDEEELNQIPTLNFHRLKVILPLGRGAKGVVFLVKDEERNEFLALKVISKALIEKKGKSGNNSDQNEYRRVCFEQGVLRRFDHPLFPKLHGVFNTEKLVGYAIDYCPGRDLHSLRKRQTEKMFSDEVIRFFAAELVLALEYLHSLGIVYRDLKPENIMIQENGHIMLVDFDLSTKLSPRTPCSSPSSNLIAKSKLVKKKKRFFPIHWCCDSGISPDDSVSPSELVVNSSPATSDSSEKSNSFVGTEEYVAPEIVSGNGHDFAVDWWSLGVVLYEMLYGTTPFKGCNRKETFYRILTKEPELTGEPTSLRDLIRKLLEKDPRQRIGIEEIKGHDFFMGMDWDSLVQIPRPPYIPENGNKDISGNNDIDVESVVQEIFGTGKVETSDDGGLEKNNYRVGDVNSKTSGWVQGLNNQNRPTTDIDNFLIF